MDNVPNITTASPLSSPDISPILPSPASSDRECCPSTMQSFRSLRCKVDADEPSTADTGLKSSRTALNSASSLDLRKIATSTQPTSPPPPSPPNDATLRRRHSAGNMRALTLESQTSEEEEDMFPMDDTESGGVVPTYAQAKQNWAERCYQIERTKRAQTQNQEAPVGGGEFGTTGNGEVGEREEGTTRTEWFLLIENLTKNMIRPCVLDLKMGTRQYGYLLPIPWSSTSPLRIVPFRKTC